MEAILQFLRQLPFWPKQSVQKFQADAQSALMIQQLSRIIGPIAPSERQRIQQLSPPQMDALAQAAAQFSTLEDLAVWLSAQGV